eukprot:1159243-Pelagomonas_calceolata.AAC.1
MPELSSLLATRLNPSKTPNNIHILIVTYRSSCTGKGLRRLGMECMQENAHAQCTHGASMRRTPIGSGERLHNRLTVAGV